jgi:hypothetical protein
VRRVRWEAGLWRSVQLVDHAYTRLASSVVGFVDGGSAVEILRCWVENLEWRR